MVDVNDVKPGRPLQQTVSLEGPTHTEYRYIRRIDGLRQVLRVLAETTPFRFICRYKSYFHTPSLSENLWVGSSQLQHGWLRKKVTTSKSNLNFLIVFSPMSLSSPTQNFYDSNRLQQPSALTGSDTFAHGFPSASK